MPRGAWMIRLPLIFFLVGIEVAAPDPRDVALLFGDATTNTSLERVQQELLTIAIPRSKAAALDFMRASTELAAAGTWQDPHNVSSDERADNVMLEVQFGEVADELVAHIPEGFQTAMDKILSRTDSEGEKRQQGMRKETEDLVIGPNLWTGIGKARVGVGAAIVGSGDSVAARLKEYLDEGIETFILSGYPHLEEAQRFGKYVMPYFAGQRVEVAAATGT